MPSAPHMGCTSFTCPLNSWRFVSVISVISPDRPPVGCPVERLIVAGEVGKLPRLAPGGGNDEHVVVPHAVAREGDPLAVGREPRRYVARDVCREPPRVRPVGSGQPDVVLVGERDGPIVRDVRKARELDRLRPLCSERASEREDGGDSEEKATASDHGPTRWGAKGLMVARLGRAVKERQSAYFVRT